MQRARLERQRRHGDRVLEQPAEVGVVAGARAGRAPQRVAEVPVLEEGAEQAPVVGVVHLAREVLEEAVELARRRGRRSAGSRAGSSALGLRLARSRAPRSAARRGSARRGPVTCTRSPRSNRPARKSASRNTRPGSRPMRSRSSSARYGAAVFAPSGGPCASTRTRPRVRRRRAARRTVARVSSTAATAHIRRVGRFRPRATSSRSGTVRHECPTSSGPTSPRSGAPFSWPPSAAGTTQATPPPLPSSSSRARFGADRRSRRSRPTSSSTSPPTRPTVKLEDGRTREIEWPDTTVARPRYPAPSATSSCSRAPSPHCAGAATARP